MTKSIRERAQSFATFMSNIPPEEIARVNEQNRKPLNSTSSSARPSRQVSAASAEPH
jgi:hypothetical protein